VVVKIRPVGPKDAAGYKRCYDVLAKERLYGFEVGVLSLPKVRAQVRHSLRQETPFLVAVDEGRIVGWAAVYGSDLPSISHCVDLGMGLLPEYRGMGLGTKMLAGLLRMCRGKFDSVFLTVVRKNKRARKLYKKMGFEPWGGVKKALKMSYGFDDTLFMQKQMRR